jgi:acyl-CoA synthetase (AMP-forming)/AMP-acid ligase II
MNSVPDLLSYASIHAPDGLAVIAANRSFTFRELDSRANRLVRLFRDYSLQAGDVVALLAKNEAEYFELHVAAMRTGLILLPLNFRLALPELEYIISDSKPKLLICAEEYSETAAALKISRKHTLGASYEALIASVEPANDKHWLISANATFVILYTSGTTGRPKGTIISNRALFARINCNLFEYQMTADDRFLMCLQLFHIGSTNCLSHLYVGSTVVIIKDFDPAQVLELLPRHRITVALWVPTMINTIIHSPEVDNADFTSLRLVVYGGSPIPPVTLSRAVELMGCGFLQTYGMTETNAITFLRPRDHDPINKPHRLASAGTPGLGMEARVVDELDRDVDTGQPGEIVCRGPCLMDEYLNLPDATAEALRGGWMHTGDVGYFNHEGYLYVTDRKKDMIVSGGENVYPREVEDVLFEHSGILEAAVIGLPDEKWGERVHAVLVFKAGIAADTDSVIAFARTRLAGYKLPKTVEVVTVLPKNAAGKVAKSELRKSCAGKQ